MPMVKAEFNVFDEGQERRDSSRNKEFEELTKRVFNTPDGLKWLEYVKSKTTERPVEPFPFPVTQDQMLAYWIHRRFREGQNNLVTQIQKELDKE